MWRTGSMLLKVLALCNSPPSHYDSFHEIGVVVNFFVIFVKAFILLIALKLCKTI